jgi:hypothetical protein
MEKFNLQYLNDVEVKEQHQVTISSLHLCETWLMMWTSLELGKVLERMQKLHPQAV